MKRFMEGAGKGLNFNLGQNVVKMTGLFGKQGSFHVRIELRECINYIEILILLFVPTVRNAGCFIVPFEVRASVRVLRSQQAH